ncbi:MAG TPA: hypothetical protein VLB86_16280 [Gaiellaceae bacterium]|nr:hypothetical protein [Gaiellaceae bacterium]
MSRLAAAARAEDGVALVLALGTLTALTLLATSTLYFSTRSSSHAGGDRASLVAEALAEAGINNAMSILANPLNNAMNSQLLPPRTTQYQGGSVSWSGTLDTIAAMWSVTATGTARGAPGTGSTRSRTVRAKVPVYPSLSQPLNNPAWNYVYSRGTGAACDTILGQSVDVKSPFYVEGNLCLQNTAKISSGPLVVHGSVTMSQNANQIGSAATPVNEVRVKNGCKYTNNPLHNPCLNGAGNQGGDNLWATSLRNDPTPVNAPVPLWDDWYLNADPGPYFPCQTSAGIVPVFDNDQGTSPNVGRRNNSVTSVLNLTPSGSYTCKTAMGELSWNATTKVLTANGTIFVDGSATVQNGAVNAYTGYATLYLSGTLLVKNSSLCALVKADQSGCTTQNWDPNSRMLVVVANGAGGQVPSDTGIQLVSGGFQGALYATYAIDVGTTSLSEGPLDGKPVKLGQSSGSAFPGFTLVPAGMPGNPAVYAQPGTPQYAG